MSLVSIIIVVFIAGIYFSSMETAFTSFDRILTIGWIRARKFGARTVRFLSASPERFLGTTLLGNSVSNVAYSSLLVLLAQTVSIHEIWLVTVSPIIVLVFSEILPKMIGYSLANRLVRFCSAPMLICYWIFLPLRLLLLPLTRCLVRRSLPAEEAVSGASFSMRKELDQILVGAEDEGAATPEEGEILTRYLDARELKVRQIMTPRTQMIAVGSEMPLEDVREVFRKSRYSILPVFERDLDHVVGYVHVRDFLMPRQSLAEVLQPIHAVPESKPIADLLEEFKRERRQVALVIDEYGGTDGLVTIKDIFEELVGPVAERFDQHDPIIKRLAPGKFLVSGSAFLEDIAKQTSWIPPQGEFNTLSGLLSDHLGRIAEAGEDIVFDNVTVRVIRRNPRYVEGCLVKLPLQTEMTKLA